MRPDADDATAANEPWSEKDGGGGLFGDLKRRKVFRVMGAYAVSAWLILQVVDVMSGALPVPDWTMAAATIILALGFPVAAALSWAFQVTPQGLKLDMTTTDAMPVNRFRLIHFIDVVIIFILIVVVILLTFSKTFSGLGADDQVRIAILPLENISDATEIDYLGTGIADDVRARLYELPQLLIAARSSSNALAARKLDARDIGSRLGVDHVLEGSLLKDGNRVRVLMELVDVNTGFASWSKSYNTAFEDVLAMQNNISLVVASQLEIILTPDVREALAKSPTDNVDAFNFYTQATEYMDRPASLDNADHAEELYRKAIDLDPEFALGFAGLCKVELRRYALGGATEHFVAAEQYCRQAMDLDTGFSEAHITLGSLYIRSGRLDQAMEAFQTALDLDATSIEAFAGIGQVFMRQGNFVDAEARFKTAVEARPGNWRGYELLAYFMLTQGRLDEAVTYYERMLELSPDNASGYNSLGAVYYMRGDFLLAAENFEQSLAMSPSRSALSNIGTMYYYGGDHERAAAMFRQAAEAASGDYRLWGNLADALRFVDGREGESESFYERAIEMALENAEVAGHDGSSYTNLAWYYANLQDAESADRYLRLAEGLVSLDGEQTYTAALVFALLGDADRARTTILSAIDLGFPRVVIDATPEFRQFDLRVPMTHTDQ